MPNDKYLRPQDEGFFDWLDRPGRTIRSLLAGEPGAAGRNIVDFLGDIPDALVPGKWIPMASREEDNISGSELLKRWGVGEMQPGLEKTATDIGVGLVTDPLTYTGIGPIAKGLKYGAEATMATKAGKAIADTTAAQSVVGAAKKARNVVADTLNWSNMTDDQKAALANYRAKAGTASSAGLQEIQDNIAPLLKTPEENSVLSDVFANIKRDPQGHAEAMLNPNRGEDWRSILQIKNEVASDIASHPSVIAGTVDAKRLTDAAHKAIDLQAVQARRGFNAPSLYQINGQVKDFSALEKEADAFNKANGTKLDTYQYLAQQGAVPIADPFEYAKGPYMQRGFEQPDALATGKGSGAPSALKSRMSEKELHEKLQTHLPWDQRTPEAQGLDMAMRNDAIQQLGARAAQQGQIEMRKQIGQDILGAPFDLSNSTQRQQVMDALEQMEKSGATRDYAVRVKALMAGEQPLDAAASALSWWNRNLFKKGTTTGVVVPRVGFMVSNSLSAIAQAISDPGVRNSLLKSGEGPKWLASRLVGGIADPIDEIVAQASKGKKALISDASNKALGDIKAAYAQAGGDSAKVEAYLRQVNPDAADMVKQGVLDNPITLDDMLTQMRPDAPEWKRLASKAWDWPASLNKHVEDRMRAGLYLAQRQGGRTADQAAQGVRDALLDYSVPTRANRTFRAWIPFGAFLSQTIPQQAKLLGEGYMTGGVSGALAGGTARQVANQITSDSTDGSPIYPDMRGSLAIPLGRDEQGNPKYLTSLRTPLESVVSGIPQSWQDSYKDIAGPANPLVKTALAASTGRDPFTGGTFGEYDKTPALLQAVGATGGTLGRTYNVVAGTGVMTPISSPIQQFSPWFDPRQTSGEAALRSLTGVRIRSVDEQRALQLELEDALKRNPEIKQRIQPYTTSDDEATKALLSELAKVKRDISDKRKADLAKKNIL